MVQSSEIGESKWQLVFIYTVSPDSLEQVCRYSLEAGISYNKGGSVTIPGGASTKVLLSTSFTIPGGASTKVLLSISFGLWSPCISYTLSCPDVPSTEGCAESSNSFHSVVPFRWSRLRFFRRWQETYTTADTIADITPPPTTPPAMAPVSFHDGEDGIFEAEPCPVLLVAVEAVDADVDAAADVEFIVTLGMVFLKMVPKALSLKPPDGETNVAPPDGLRQGQ